ncbi:MAG: AI-2E family transporter [Solirubrobacterales bacterium]
MAATTESTSATAGDKQAGEERIAQLERQVELLRDGERDRRTVSVDLRNVLHIALLGLVIALTLAFIYVAWAGITLLLMSLLVALALDPGVTVLMRRGLGRGWATGAVFLLTLLVAGGLAALIVPSMVDQVGELVDRAPGYVDDLKQGEGPLGGLERRFGIVDGARQALEAKEGVAGTGLSVLGGVLGTVGALVAVTFLSFFMVLEGPRWLSRISSVLPDASVHRWERAGAGIYRTVSGFVLGSLLSSLLVGIVVGLTLVIAGVPFAVPIALLVAFLILIPVLGPIIAMVTVGLIALATSGLLTGLIVTAVVFTIHQIEIYVLKPLIFERTVDLSPLVVLAAVVVGTELAGVIGALVAIPVAGTVQVVVTELVAARRETLRDCADDPEAEMGLLGQL